MTRAELIVYATPVGPLATALDDLYVRLENVGRSRAQDYPPHCTLTGFFSRAEGEIPRILGELANAIDGYDHQPGQVDVVALHRRADWIGLELRSEWLHDVTARFATIHRRAPDDDSLRLKDWLHVSIAYGDDDLGAAMDASGDFDHRLAATWEVGLWRRHGDGSWTHHGPGGDTPGPHHREPPPR